MTKRNKEVNEIQTFHRLVREISALLVGARSSEIENALDCCLAKVGEYFDVSHVSMGQISKAGELLPSLRMWGDSAVKFLNVDPPGPEMVAYFSREGSLTWSCLEDLEMLPQWQKHCRQLGVTAGSLWLYRDFGSHVQGMALSRSGPKKWSEDTIEYLSTIGQFLFNAFYRWQAEIEAEQLKRLEHVISNIASRFVDVPELGVEAETVIALGEIGETTDAEVCVFLKCTDQDTSTLAVSNEWYSGELDGPCFGGANFANDYPWLFQHLKKGEQLFLSNPDDLPPAAEAEIKLFEQTGIQSMLWVPFATAHDTHGYIGLGSGDSTARWTDVFLPQLELVGVVLANAVDRQTTDFALTQAFNEIQDLKDRLLAENETLRQDIVELYSENEIIGRSHVFQTTILQAEQVAHTDSTVLLLGETGTGKGLIARRIHEQSGRSHHPMITVNCAALPSTLIESELFGHDKGAFTGAINRKIGRFELADSGTIFLDEIGDLPTELQAKMLRVLQDGEFERVGSSTTKTADVRVIAATNRNLDGLIEKGEFRADLYYRLSVFPIRIPPLRERRGDIPLLVWFFISELQHRLGKTFDEIYAPAMDALTSYDWPGNIRELRNIIERAMILSPGTVLKLDSGFPGSTGHTHASSQSHKRTGETMEEVERAHIKMVLEACDWKVHGKHGAAEYLGLKRTTLQSRMKKLGIKRPAA
jgi:transcriptional regulator with GAF, ATPase, and Fis domain